MADNIDVTPGTGKTIAADDIGGVLHQRVKVEFGADSSATDVSSANPLPAVISHTDTAPSTQNITAADAATSTTTGANSQAIYTGTPTANSAASFTLSGQASVIIQTTGTWVATLQVEISMDGGTTWFARGVHQAGTSYTSVSFTGNFAGGASVSGYTNVRVRATAYTSGTATVKITETLNLNSFYVANSIKISDPTTPSQQMAVDSSGRITSNLNATTGSGTATGALRVELPTNGTGVVGLNAGTNAIGKLTANSGVTIGDVNIVSEIPGTGATNLGKAEDSVHSSGDTGVASLAVYKATPTQLAGTDQDYSVLETGGVGELYTGLATLISGEDQVNNIQAVLTKPVASAAYAPLTYQQSASVTKANIKATPGNVYSFRITNGNAAVRYFQLHNKSSAPAAADTAQLYFVVPAGTATAPGVLQLSTADLAPSENFTTGIGWAISTTATTFTDSATAGDHNTNVRYV
jgi:hypothetical protein